MVNIPAQYEQDVEQAASYTGLPVSVVAAQINEESGFDPNAVSPSNAEGIAQFLPSTYNSVMNGQGSPFNPTDAFQAYEIYMKQLLGQEGGNVQDALAAYNAGPGDISAGLGYANTILANAGQPINITAGGGSGAQTTSLLSDIPQWISALFGGEAGAVAPQLGKDLGALVEPSNWKLWLERGALMLFGGILILIGIWRLSAGGGNSGGGKEYLKNAKGEVIAQETEV
jgi:hypothetical protein